MRSAGGPLALSVVCIVVLAASGYLGGKLAYHYGVRVADEQTQAAGFAGGAAVAGRQPERPAQHVLSCPT